MCVCVSILKKPNNFVKKEQENSERVNYYVLIVQTPKLLLKGQIALSKKRNVSYKINLIWISIQMKHDL